MKASATVTPMGATYPVEGVTFPSNVFHGRQLGPSWICNGGVPDVTPFVKASLLKFCLSHDVAFWLRLLLFECMPSTSMLTFGKYYFMYHSPPHWHKDVENAGASRLRTPRCSRWHCHVNLPIIPCSSDAQIDHVIQIMSCKPI